MQLTVGIALILAGLALIMSDVRHYRRWGKRTLDLILGTILFLAFFPVMIVVSIVVFIDAGWPILFTQKRIGCDLKEFTIYKFHTLKGLNGQSYQVYRTYEECERNASRIGSFLRHHCLDELPQFVNVIKGDLSLVGNRPNIWGYFKQFDIPLDTVRSLYSVKPGLTGYVQIVCFKNNCDNPDRYLKYGLAYAHDCSFWVDLKLLFKTVFVLFRGR